VQGCFQSVGREVIATVLRQPLVFSSLSLSRPSKHRLELNPLPWNSTNDPVRWLHLLEHVLLTITDHRELAVSSWVPLILTNENFNAAILSCQPHVVVATLKFLANFVMDSTGTLQVSSSLAICCIDGRTLIYY
jgi:hypothetical protein